MDLSKLTEVSITEIPDGCAKCDGTGVEKFSTEQDRLNWQDDDMDDDFGPDTSGRRPCSVCEGVGSIPGNGPLVKFRITLRGGFSYRPNDISYHPE